MCHMNMCQFLLQVDPPALTTFKIFQPLSVELLLVSSPLPLQLLNSGTSFKQISNQQNHSHH